MLVAQIDKVAVVLFVFLVEGATAEVGRRQVATSLHVVGLLSNGGRLLHNFLVSVQALALQILQFEGVLLFILHHQGLLSLELLLVEGVGVVACFEPR